MLSFFYLFDFISGFIFFFTFLHSDPALWYFVSINKNILLTRFYYVFRSSGRWSQFIVFFKFASHISTMDSARQCHYDWFPKLFAANAKTSTNWHFQLSDIVLSQRIYTNELGSWLGRCLTREGRRLPIGSNDMPSFSLVNLILHGSVVSILWNVDICWDV